MQTELSLQQLEQSIVAPVAAKIIQFAVSDTKFFVLAVTLSAQDN